MLKKKTTPACVEISAVTEPISIIDGNGVIKSLALTRCTCRTEEMMFISSQLADLLLLCCFEWPRISF